MGFGEIRGKIGKDAGKKFDNEVVIIIGEGVKNKIKLSHAHHQYPFQVFK